MTSIRAAFNAIAMARPSHLEGRLLAILDRGRNRAGLTVVALVVALAVAAALVVPVAMLDGASPISATHEVQLWVDAPSPVPRSTLYTLDGRYYDDLDSFLWNLRELAEPTVPVKVGAHFKRWLRDLAKSKPSHRVHVHVNPPAENARKAVNELVARCRKLGEIDNIEVSYDLTGVPVAFGEVREVELEDFDVNRRDALFDFDSGTVLNLPAGEKGFTVDSIKLADWAEKAGADVVARRVGGGVELIGLDMTLLQAETNAWHTIDPRRLIQSPSLLRRGEQVGLKPGQSLAGMSPIFTHGILFRTREAGLGIAQLVSRADAPNAVRVRYKMLQVKPAPVRAAGTSFGPVIERVMRNNTESDTCLIDLDRNKVFADSSPDDAGLEWGRQKGIDAIAMTQKPEGIRGLIGLEIRMVPVPPDYWDSITPAALAKQLSSVPPLREAIMRGENTLPTTFLFITREGGMGILQITGFTDDPRAVRFRYKMVEAKGQGSAAKAESTMEIADAKADAAARSREYMVVQGDTLAGIAQAHGRLGARSNAPYHL